MQLNGDDSLKFDVLLYWMLLFLDIDELMLIKIEDEAPSADFSKIIWFNSSFFCLESSGPGVSRLGVAERNFWSRSSHSRLFLVVSIGAAAASVFWFLFESLLALS